jgi:spoIIIJ-associated protein
MSTEKKRFKGRDVTEAMAAAREHFNLSRREIAYEIVERRQVGPLEKVEGEVEIEAWQAESPREIAVEEPRERRDRGDRGDRGGRGRGRDRDRGDRGRGRDRDRDRDERPRREREPVEEVPFVMPELFPDTDETDVETVLRTLSDALITGLDLDLRVARVSKNEIGVRVHLEGEDAHELTDADGEALDALQYLGNRLLAKDGRLDVRVSFDAGGYRERHETRLIEQAQQFAKEVLAGDDAKKMPAMGPYERRLVHIALAEIEGIRTFSTGSGYNRRLHVAKAEDGASDD